MHKRGTILTCALAALTLIASTLITGCGMGTPAAPSANGLSGRAMGGNFPIVGGRVYLFSAGTSGYGSASTPLLSTTLNPTDVQTDSNHNTYVLTDSNGDFNVTGDYACLTSTDQVYILIAGGNPGLSDPPADDSNPALALLAALGPCGLFNGSSTLTLDPSSFVVVDEVTTVATVYALSQFMTDATDIGTSSVNLTGLANAFATVNNLVDNATGSAKSTFTLTGYSVSKTVTAPHDEIDYLANALVPCVNSKGDGSSPCPDLYTASGNTAADETPTDTVQAMLAIARAPAANENAVWDLPTGLGNPPFDTGSFAQPADWSVALTYTDGNNDGQSAVLDVNGALWSYSVDGSGDYHVIGISNNGTPLTPATGLYTSSLYIASIAFDTHNDLWVAETDFQGDATSDVKEIDPDSGTVLQTVSGSGTGLDQTNADPNSMTIDGSNNIWLWLASATFGSTPGSVDMISANDGYTAPAGFPSTNGGFNNDYLLIADVTGNLFAGGQINPGVAGIAPDGTGISGAPFVTSTSIVSMAMDANSKICFTSFDPDNPGADVYRMGEDGTLSPLVLEPEYAQSLTVDGGNNVWLTTSAGQPTQLVEVDNSGNTVQSFGTTNVSGTSLAQTTLLDSSGNFWLAMTPQTPQVFTIVEYVGAAPPVQTPTALQLNDNTVGQRPDVYGPI